ncbi:MAG TPA: hypothetical protein VLA77_02790 [Candidatus Saccharimonadales bacterium]|nr:hypothetical protein [Candidatus Saccharimonadales bacterium]
MASDDLPVFYKAEKSEIIKIVSLAAAVGLLIPLLSEVISVWVIAPIFCQNPNDISICTNGGMISYYISAVIINIAAVSLLINIDVNKPLVIVFGSLLALWGLKGFLTPLMSGSFVEYLIISVVLYVLCYVAFYWFMRIRSFGLAMFFAAVTVMAVRWILLV